MRKVDRKSCSDISQFQAELGRSRQDELPLSNQAKRPTYLPGRSGTSHIPQARKEKLESKWGVKIVDEESQQMEGLELGNARPWATLTSHYMASHAAESAPPRFRKEAKPARTFAVPKPPSSIRSSGSISKVPVPTLPSASNKKVPANQNTQANRGTTARSSSKMPAAPPGSKPKPNPSTPLQVQEHILSLGDCEIINESDSSSSEIKFMLKVQLQKNKGLLAMQLPDKGISVHDVLTLGAPVIQGPFCLISNAQRERLYKLKFRTSAAAEGFQYLLKSLQQSALLFRETGLVSLKQTPTPTAKIAASYLNTPSKTQPQVAKTVPMGANDSEKTPLQTPTSIEASLQRDTQESLPGESLVDTEDGFCSNPALTIEAAADHMQGLVQQILSEITAAGIKVPENGIDEIESTAISNWMDQGFMKTETQSDELKEELAELLRLLVRIKRKVQFRHGSNHVNPVAISSETLQDLQEIVEKPSKRIKYTPTDIKELKAQAVSRQDKIKASGLYEIQKGSPPKKKKVQSIAKQKDQVISSSHPRAAGGLATSRWASTNGTLCQRQVSVIACTDSASKEISVTSAKLEAVKEWAAIPPKAATAAAAPMSLKSNPKGLSSSRWADKPVENEGKFAGF
ncbi:hypothetical protein M441DRAFT_458603 [Trichoderma asperellum CBS 433.97]|uniref:Uncharacterized protein n=1 Tax=Trichoderma asperellum (strain ATCC 204424 / CBS 433.97 / NBRC 101777) TaxID=1042311 RepID=A0A2T3Z8A7_TRIA4|nr:hypothetical protein M441DRAFT_458603 [Trichoderma asperellum CBS 433.97]PTB41025.1 hypothetical protein M441DRAFT_458603 [Trichoderma asperellum CBS 433.97]